MQNLSNLMNLNWLEVLLGLIGGGIISWIISLIYYRRAKSESRLACRSTSYKFLSQHKPLADIEIRFRGLKVPQVTKSLVAIWNDGNTTIDKNQIVESDPLQIVITPPESEILDYTVLRETRAVTKFDAYRAATNVLFCDFEWLDATDGGLIEILHSGEAVTVQGTLKGIPKGVVNLGSMMWVQRKKKRNLGDIFSFFGILLMFFFILTLCVNGIVKGLYWYRLNQRSAAWVSIVTGVLGCVGIASLLVAILRKSLRQPEGKPPEILRLSDGDW